MAAKDIIQHQFKPGHSGNPAGSHPWPAQFRQVRKLTKAELAEVGSMLLKNDMAALEAMDNAPGTTVLQQMVVAIARRIIKSGDHEALNALLNRLIGPVRTEVSHHIIVGQTLVERVASVLEKRLHDQPGLLLAIAEDLQDLLSEGEEDQAPPIDVPAEPQSAAAEAPADPKPEEPGGIIPQP